MDNKLREYKCRSLDDIVSDFNDLLHYINELNERIERLESPDTKEDQNVTVSIFKGGDGHCP